MDKSKKILAGITSDKKNKQTNDSSKTTEKVSSSENAAATASSKERTDIVSSRVRMVQNFHLVWLDGSIDEITNEDCRNTIIQLRKVMNTVNTFTNVDECIDFISGIKEEKTFMISSGTLCHTAIPVVHDMRQVSAIYIFCESKVRHEQWARQWPKVKGVFTDIIPICEALKHGAQECDQNSVSMSFVPPNIVDSSQNLDQLEPSFMYTQILKEILLTIDFKQEHFMEFITYCREQLVGNLTELNNVDKLDQEYHAHVPIWWYTYQCFLFSMLNRALRMMEVDLIIKMGFFVQDLHKHIAQLYSEQYAGDGHSPSFTVFRGQGLFRTDFDQLKKTRGGLLSFNNFLSTSTKREMSLKFARQTIASSDDLVGILFVMTIDPSVPSTPFAKIRHVSCYQGEEEILFSMHSIFRIGHIKQMGNNSRLWQVDLTLTSANDPQLHVLTQRMREETFPDQKGWYRLGSLLIKLGQFDKAQQVFEILLDQTTDARKKVDIYHALGTVKDNLGKYTEALAFYEKSLKIGQKILPANHPSLATSYGNIGLVYNNMGEYSKALSSHEKALEIFQKTHPANHPDFATSYNSIGFVYDKVGEYSKALLNYEKALEILQKTLPPNHPNFAASYNNIGSVYEKMGEYPKALSSHEKALEIFQKTLPANHPTLAVSYNNIGSMYDTMGEYSKALSYYEKALGIIQKTLPANHPTLATFYNNIGLVYKSMGEHSKGLAYYEKSLEIRQKILPADHPDLATSYNNIGLVYCNMRKYSKALSSHEKALGIFRKTLPENHPSLAASYNNIGMVYNNMGECSKALSNYEKALEIMQKTLPANQPSLAAFYNNIGAVHSKIGEYSKAISYYEKSLEIRQKTLPADHPDLATSYNNIGAAYSEIHEYSKALSYYEKSLKIKQKLLPADHPDLATSCNNIGCVYEDMGDYSKALSVLERARNILQRSVPENDPNLRGLRQRIERAKKKCK